MSTIIPLLFSTGLMAEVQGISKAIEDLRMGTLVIKAPVGATVSIKQLRHEFWFGTAIAQNMFTGNEDPKDVQQYFKILKANFNSAVHENALKWYSTEDIKDDVSYNNADIMLKWCEDNDMPMRGHCLFWSDKKYVQKWIKKLDDEELRSALKGRAHNVTQRYKGRIREYDVNNEMLHCNYYKKRLGGDIRQDMFEWCKTSDPNAILYVNDYNILNDDDLDRYEKQIQGFIDSEMAIGGIGLQGHFGQEGVDAKKVKRVLERLSKFNLPIKITEFDVNSDDEEIKERGLIDLYTTAFSHPSVVGILMWGFWEGNQWRPKGALWKKDWTPTKAAKAYQNLIYKQWWSRAKGRADKSGTFSAKVFFGRYEVSVDENPPKVVYLSKDEKVKTLDMTAP